MRWLNDIYKLLIYKGNRDLVIRSVNLIIKVILNYLLNKLKKMIFVFFIKLFMIVY